MRADLEKLKLKMEESNTICFTMDTDWASEYAIENTIGTFEAAGIKPTVFTTNESRIIREKIKQEKIDAGIHPNFIEGSSQGNSAGEIINYCMQCIPATKVFRCHRWYSDNDVYDLLYKKGFRYESNLCTCLDVVPPFIHRSGMICFPVFLEDGAYILHKGDLQFRNVSRLFAAKGLKVINIHPMHYMLNTPYFSYTRKIKDSVSRERWNNLNGQDIGGLRHTGRGITDFISELIEYAVANCRIVTLKELYEQIALDALE